MTFRLPLVLVSLAFIGCSSVARFQMPGTDLADVQRLYINLEEEERAAEELLSMIKSNLTERGYEVGMNDGSVTFGQGDYVFDYAPDWHWDIAWYLLDLRVAIYEPETNTLVAQAHSQQSSLARKSNEVIVERALVSLFDDAQETKGERK